MSQVEIDGAVVVLAALGGLLLVMSVIASLFENTDRGRRIAYKILDWIEKR